MKKVAARTRSEKTFAAALVEECAAHVRREGWPELRTALSELSDVASKASAANGVPSNEETARIDQQGHVDDARKHLAVLGDAVLRLHGLALEGETTEAEIDAALLDFSAASQKLRRCLDCLEPEETR